MVRAHNKLFLASEKTCVDGQQHMLSLDPGLQNVRKLILILILIFGFSSLILYVSLKNAHIFIYFVGQNDLYVFAMEFLSCVVFRHIVMSDFYVLCQ